MSFPKIFYWPFLLIPTILWGLGFASNALVMAANGGQMPVLVPGGCNIQEMAEESVHSLHSCMTHATHLKFLADWIVIRHVGVGSIGDLLEWQYDWTFIPALCIWAVLVIKKLNERE